MPTVKEKVYDDQIFPLMSQILKICKDNKIDMVFDAYLGYDDQAGEDLHCTSALLKSSSPEHMHRAFKILKPN
jgi:hypothetical protein